MIVIEIGVSVKQAYKPCIIRGKHDCAGCFIAAVKLSAVITTVPLLCGVTVPSATVAMLSSLEYQSTSSTLTSLGDTVATRVTLPPFAFEVAEVLLREIPVTVLEQQLP
jgi:hypothetical protein